MHRPVYRPCSCYREFSTSHWYMTFADFRDRYGRTSCTAGSRQIEELVTCSGPTQHCRGVMESARVFSTKEIQPLRHSILSLHVHSCGLTMETCKSLPWGTRHSSTTLHTPKIPTMSSSSSTAPLPHRERLPPPEIHIPMTIPSHLLPLRLKKRGVSPGTGRSSQGEYRDSR